MYTLIEYSDIYSKTFGSLWQYFKDVPAVNNNGDVLEFNGANATVHWTGQSGDNATKEDEIIVPSKYLVIFDSFWNNIARRLEMALVTYEINLVFSWSANCVLVYTNVANQGATIVVTETKLYDQQLVYQLKIMQNYYKNQVLKNN